MVEKAGLGKHRRGREAKGFDDAGEWLTLLFMWRKMVIIREVEVAMEDVQGGRGSGR